MSEKKHYHRGRRRSSTLSGSRGNSGHDRDRAKRKAKGSRKGRIVSNIVLAVAILVFCVSAFQLFRILSGYYEGRKEYDEVKELAITEEESEDGDTRFTVDFDTLLGINPDTVGWIRFDPEPSQIN